MVRSHAWATGFDARNTDRGHQLLEGGEVADLPTRQRERQRSAAPVARKVDLRGESAPGPAEGVSRFAGFLPSPLAPAACWWGARPWSRPTPASRCHLPHPHPPRPGQRTASPRMCRPGPNGGTGCRASVTTRTASTRHARARPRGSSTRSRSARGGPPTCACHRSPNAADAWTGPLTRHR